MTLEEIYGNAKALVEDKTYQIGEISEKTGLQKTANGWVKPKSNKKESVKSEQINKTWSQSDVVKSVPNGWKKDDGVTTVPNGYVAITNGKSRFGEGGRETKIIKEEYFKKADNKTTKSAQEELEKRNKENGVEKKTNKKPSIQEYMKAKDLMKKHEAQYKKEMDDFEYMERLKANGVNTSIFNPMFGGKPQPLENRSSYKEAMETVKSYETTDNACRITADTKIKLKNVVENKVKENA